MTSLFAREIKFTQTVNKAIHQFHVEIPVYRTIDGKVTKCPIRMLRVNLQNGDIEVEYEVNKNYIDIFTIDIIIYILKFI